MECRKKSGSEPRLSQSNQSLFSSGVDTSEIDKIQTLKISEPYYTESFPIEINYLMCQLEITLKDGTVTEEDIEADEALSKYAAFFNNPNDENYHHNSECIKDSVNYGP